MDPLRIVTKYNTRRLSETLISSFLNYFLDPLEDHGFGYTFVARYLHALELLDDEREFWSDRTSVGVESEVTLPSSAGRIDSLVWVRRGRQVWVAATEVKIHDSSAKNLSADGVAQLDRYYESINSMSHGELKKLLFGESEDEVQFERILFVYLVPSESKQWRQEVRDFCGRVLDARKANENSVEFKILPWSQLNDAPHSDDSHTKALLTRSTLEELIRGLLEDQSIGAVPQPDEHALHLLRCIRNAALNDFRYVFPSRLYEAPFPDHGQFLEALSDNDQREVLECVMAASYTPRKANSLHTTIGIPITTPKTLPNNSLLAIRTTETYANPSPLGYVEIEFDEQTYDTGRIDLQSVVNSTLLPASNVFDPQGLTLRAGVHPDTNETSAVNKKKVRLLKLEKGKAFENESATRMLEEFFDELRSRAFGVIRRVGDDGKVTLKRSE